MHKAFESAKRSFLKTISWKIIATAISFIVTYIHSGDIRQAIETSVIISAVGLVAYYIHERLWNQIHWEKKIHHDHH